MNTEKSRPTRQRGTTALSGTPKHGSSGQADCNMGVSENQGPAFSEGEELAKKFQPKRIRSEKLAEIYERIGESKKAGYVADCGTWLEFAHENIAGEISEKGKLHKANFCRDRLCPMCSWRRSYKIFAQVSQIMDVIHDKYKFLFLTLTVPNCAPETLSVTISAMMDGWRRLIHQKPFKTAVKGFFRALEVTRNDKTGYFHPHFHVVLAVSPHYFKDSSYIKRDDWLRMWQLAMKDPSITQVDIRVARSKNGAAGLASAVAEIAKYAVKDSDYLIEDSDILSMEVVRILMHALKGRRLSHFGGIFSEIHRKLGLDDSENGDLVHIGDEINSALSWLIVRYGWSCGVYKIISAEMIAKGA